MKSLKLLLATLFALVTLGAEAQNVQAHYDFGRKSATTTVEMFRADGGGSTFFFVDMDYSPLWLLPTCDQNRSVPAHSAPRLPMSPKQRERQGEVSDSSYYL